MAAHNDHKPADYRHRDRVAIRRALLSVSDKTGIIDLATKLAEAGVDIISTGGTYAAISAAGIPVTEVSEITGFPETLDGRVKTLHPTIHAGLLADMRLIAHEGQLDALNVLPFELVVVNLYPFVQTVQSGAKGDAVVEQIDIGGPAMVRASAKNHANVAIVVDPAKYGDIIEAIEQGGTTLAQRRELAFAAFSHTARYDAAVSAWFAAELEGDWKKAAGQDEVTENANPGFEKTIQIEAQLGNVLRYGENSHQAAAIYRTTGEGAVAGIAQARQFGGKEMSYNNYVDADAALRAAYDFTEPAVAIIKHANPCGIAIGDANSADPIADAHAKAHMCDSVSAFGGVIASNRVVTVTMAKQVASIFTEVIIAPGYELEALQILLEKKNLRVLELPANYSREALEFRQISGGVLVQQPDEFSHFNSQGWKLVTGKKADAETMAELEFAWRACRSVKSNGILLSREGASVGVGMGQVNRVDSCKLAVERAASRAKGSVAASDAFFPFADGLQILLDAGVRAVVQPGGSVRDAEVIAAAEAAGVTMYFTGERHFFH
ncbi:bifunctional phosphoribosylaminoimidazolecarboxamide formyltransferase/IMP cyclohydrolase [Rhodoluna sp. KAS3]|uniref:bifunctional phosphoribosylaminoimidazolecarboxamide formyltransferase/IMP cyclohydrolase n=1 Tax=Rhodoluna sp. KAS3 TaxID=942880 RepID=UPI00222F6135|nr:bifunctional phosphoribosylaminoimidazolecarboxamide formyltransferase/IMP cyclohydrolase [Rhodoluna sp. KAS3]BDS48624.1 bifunctional purine biosynthesis protein PurH [Rhodoluna sp. KAS3]